LIELAANRSAAQANVNLLHELAHCAQAEAHGVDWPTVYRLSPEVFEVEAEAFALEAAEAVRPVIA
jgi:hypothetical protein